MSNKRNQLKRKKYYSAEALNIIISEEYTLGTSSSDNSSSESSYYEEMSDKNSRSPSPKHFKGNIIQQNTCENKTLYEHGKIHITDLSQRHVQPTSAIPTTLPEATKKLDTPSIVDLRLGHDNSDDQHSPHTLQINAPSQLEEEFVVSIPIELR